MLLFSPLLDLALGIVDDIVADDDPHEQESNAGFDHCLQPLNFLMSIKDDKHRNDENEVRALGEKFLERQLQCVVQSEEGALGHLAVAVGLHSTALGEDLDD